MYRLEPKPLWMEVILGKGTWVTLAPVIYHPRSVKDPHLHTGILAHEVKHIEQQTNYPGGVPKWLYRYLTDKAFRLSQEIEAAVADLETSKSTSEFCRMFKIYCQVFSSKMYWSMATYKEVEDAFLSYLSKER